MRKAVACIVGMFFILLAASVTNPLTAQPYAGITVNSQLFSDDIWFFGTYAAPDNGCVGVMFKKEGAKHVVYDYSQVGKVNSWENSLSVSTPSCDGSFVFYTQHNHMFNSQHQPMKGGKGAANDPGFFDGDNSVADGLAACYIGTNRYLFVAVAGISYKPLRAYIVDMNGDNGLGELIYLKDIEAGNTVTESIEIIPVKNTRDNYWLIYNSSDGVLRVRKITVDKTNPQKYVPVIGNVLYSASLPAAAYTYLLRSSPTYNQLVITDQQYQRYHLLHFNPETGEIKYDKVINPTIPKYTNGLLYVYGAEFSPGGRYLYISTYAGYDYMQRYDLVNSRLENYFLYNSAGSGGSGGGGFKRGPDGRMYVTRQHTQWLGVIEEPDSPTDYTGKYVEQGLKLNITSYTNLPLSTGITPPAVDPPTVTSPPVVVKDVATTTNSAAVTVNVLANDTGADGHPLTLTGAFVSNTAHGTVAITEAGNVTFTPSQTYNFVDNEKVMISYTAQDKQAAPIPLCSSGELEVTIRVPALTVIVPAPKQFNEASTVSVQVCLPEGFAAPAGGQAVNLSRGASSTAVATTHYSMPASVTIAAGQRCVSFNLVLLDRQLIVDGDKTLVIQASAARLTSGSDALTIKDVTTGDVIAEPVSPGKAYEAPTPTPGTYSIRFKGTGVTCVDPVKVSFTVADESGSLSPTTYTLSQVSPVTIPAGVNGVTVALTPVDNYVVDGGKKVVLTITNVERLTTP